MLQWKTVRSVVLLIVLVLVAAVLAQAGSDGGLAPTSGDDPGTRQEFIDNPVPEIHFGW